MGNSAGKDEKRAVEKHLKKKSQFLKAINSYTQYV